MRARSKLLRWGTGAAMAASMVFGSVASGGPAEAAGRPYVGTSSADMFWCTSVQRLCANEPFARIAQGTPLKMVCWVDDRAPFTGASRRWFYSLLDNGQEGYLWAPQVANQTPNTPRCDSVNWLNTANWAIGHLGQTTGSSTEAAQFTAADWAPGPVGEWSGDCPKFTFLAWGKQTLRGNAIDLFRQYRSLGRVHPGRPPRGALVFWNRTNLGHVAISIGNWQAIGTQGVDNQRLPIARYGVNTPDYLGWTMPVTPTVPQNPA
jgi:hypothetical protein